MLLALYGIRNCDTVKKARRWLDEHGVAYRFHDYKIDGVGKQQLMAWSKKLGWEALLNRAGTTFRKLDAADKADLTETRAVALMLAQPSMIKRPLIERRDGICVVGFKPDDYRRIFETADAPISPARKVKVNTKAT